MAFSGASPGTDAVELGLDITALLRRGSPAALDQGGLEPGAPLRMRVERRFPGTLIVFGA